MNRIDESPPEVLFYRTQTFLPCISLFISTFDSLTLAGQHRSVKLQIKRLDYSNVCGHFRAISEHTQVAQDQLGRGYFLLESVADHSRLGSHQVPDRGHHSTRGPVLEALEGGLEQNDE